MTTAGVCEVHGSHRPNVLLPHHHHIQPLGMGGPDVPENIVTICPTGHFNVHTVLAALVFDRPVPHATTKEIRLARQGFDTWVRAGRPGNPHSAYGMAHPA